MKLGYTIIYVADVPATMTFYEEAFGLKQKFLHESHGYGEMDTGETTLSFAANEVIEGSLPDGFRKNSLEEVPAAFEIAFTTEDVASAFHKALAKGAVEVHAPEEKPWGQTVAYVRDRNGVLVEICTPMG